MSLSDSTLVARVVLGDDRHAFAEIVRRHQAMVRGLARKLAGGDYALADDVAQETFVRAWKGLGDFDGRAKLSTWLCTIAWRVFLAERDRAARGRTELEARDGATVQPAQVGLRHDIEQALASLKPAEREAIALAFGQGLTHDEAAHILGCPLGTLKTNVARGLEKLEKRLGAWRATA